MSRYNLTDLYEGMTNDEFAAAKEADRLEAHPDRDKIKAIQAMIAKERESKNSVKEMTGEAYNRIDGLINQSMKNRFLNGFQELYMDMVEAGDMFDVMDVINYLSNEMQDYAKDTKMDQGGIDYDDENFSDPFIDSNLEEGVENGLKQMGYSDSDIEDFMDEYKQGGSKLPKKVKDYLDGLYNDKLGQMQTKSLRKEESTRGGGNKFGGVGLLVYGRTTEDNQLIDQVTEEEGYYGIFNAQENYWFFPEEEETIDALENNLETVFIKKGINARFEGQFNENLNEEESTPISKKEILQALIPVALNKEEIKQYMQSLSKSGDIFDNVDDYIEDFKNYIADKSIQEHFGRFLKDYQ
jgi:hypothetical protein